jgi:hypothetical protein
MSISIIEENFNVTLKQKRAIDFSIDARYSMEEL